MHGLDWLLSLSLLIMSLSVSDLISSMFNKIFFCYQSDNGEKTFWKVARAGVRPLLARPLLK